MALTALATANTTIGPAQWADMAQALAPRFLVDGPTHLQPTDAGATISITPGAALIAGTRITATGTNTVTIPSVTSGTRTYALLLRIDWTKGASNAASLIALSTPTLNPSASPDTGKINRIPGVLYDAVLATCQRSAGATTLTNLTDYRTWGGDGGPLRVSTAALDTPTWLDARAGTMICTDQGVYTKRLDNDGVWRAVGTDSNPWRNWVPTLRWYGDQTPNGTSGGTVGSPGTGGTLSGRYRVVDGMLDGYVQLIRGSSSPSFGRGPITIDLPLACASWQVDTWSMGHIFTNSGDGLYDWHSEALIKAGWTRAMLWAPASAADGRLYAHQSCDTTGATGTGVPFILNGYSHGAVYTYHLNYPVTE